MIKLSEVGSLPRRKVPSKFGVISAKIKNIRWCQPIRILVTCRDGNPQYAYGIWKYLSLF